MGSYKAAYIACIGGFTLAVGLGVALLVLDATDQRVSSVALCGAVTFLLEGWVMYRLGHPPEARPVTNPVPGVEVVTNMDEKAPTAKTKGVEAWDKLPTVPVPSLGDVRQSVIAFATKYGFQPYEAERGYALLDGEGNWYRAAVV